MSIKIGGNTPMLGMKKYDAVQKVQAPRTISQEADRVELSAAPRLFGEALAAVKNSPEIRLDKVSELQQRIDSGTYRVDSGEIAEKIIAGGK